MKLKSKTDKLLRWFSGLNQPQAPVLTPPTLEPYDGRTPLLDFGHGDYWTFRDLYMGTMVFGGTGSGKTSGSGMNLALALLNHGCGGLVMSVKPDDRDLWEELASLTGRKITAFGPENANFFNFMKYEYARPGLGAGLITNVAELFSSIAQRKSGQGGSNEEYFDNAMKQMLRRGCDAVTRGTGTLSLPLIMDAIMSAPQTLDEARSKEWSDTSFLAKCLREAEAKRTDRNGPDLDHTRRYWLQEFPALADRTRSAVVSVFTVLADGFLTSPMRELFCGDLTIVPEETHAGKIIFLDLPVEVYKEVGIAAQMLWKHCWQEATARRQPEKDGGIPTFLWADESQFFCSKSDNRFQATARSKRAGTIFLTQNISELYDRVGKDRTNSLLANLQTRILHSNGCHITNTWAADSIARGIVTRSSSNISVEGGVSFGASESVDYVVPPAEFQKLRTGGVENNNTVDAYVLQAGRRFRSTGESYTKVSFKQPKRN